jgi:hypothetical protein
MKEERRSALPPKADIRQRNWHVRFGQEADIPAICVAWLDLYIS